MTIKVSDKLPKNSILRSGTLIIGVPKHDVDDPMAPAARSLEAALQKKIAEANIGTERDQKSETKSSKKLTEDT